MTKKMLIDATHPEETRVVVVDGHKLEEFDFEAATRRQLIGNIYLAKVTRVEPSLQAAFIEYGGNRHGFLAFSEIHPDYYQIPVADRQALLEQQAAAEREAAEDDQDSDEESAATEADAEAAEAETGDEDGEAEFVPAEAVSPGTVEPLEEFSRPRPYRRSYKIQEVIKKRQILLVQVMKDERGTKGAALTTYLSLPGRYCVLMPNTARGGGISRKITKAVDRKKLKSIATELDVPEGMGLIIRTAGANRTRAEIKRDFESLLRLWEDLRDRTLKSTAPTLIYEEGNLIKRAIRDLYTKDIDAIILEGEDGYREAKSFMRMLMPSHAKNVQLYKDRPPLFQRYGVESQIYSMFNPVVQLPAGGYVVFDQTEALVAIDVNSGKATREHNIEATATHTNLEAAEEIARQLRLRDLAGLIVIDFIDMEENRNIRAVERKLKDCLKSDRARIQVGRISAFGLMEMSRQRLRTGVVEISTQPCPHCHGTGLIRSVESTALHILRSVEEECMKRRAAEVTVTAPTAVALYILNQKRAWLAGIETEYGVTVLVVADPAMVVPDHRIDRTRVREPGSEPFERPKPASVEATPVEDELDAIEVEVEAEVDEDEEPSTVRLENGAGEDDGKRRKRRRRRRRRRGDEKGPESAAADGTFAEAADGDAEDADEPEAESGGSEAPAEPVADPLPAGVDDLIAAAGPLPEDPDAPTAEAAEAETETEKPKRTRRRSGEGRTRSRRPRRAAAAESADAGLADVARATDETVAPAIPAEAPAPAAEAEAEPIPLLPEPAEPAASPDAEEAEAAVSAPVAEAAPATAPEPEAAEPETAEDAEPLPQAEPVWPDAPREIASPAEPEPAQRRGWWQRRLSR